MKTLLICHEGALLVQEGLSRWLGSFSEVAGIVVIREKSRAFKNRVKREIKRVGWLRFIDVAAFRLYYRFFLFAKDEQWERETLRALYDKYPLLPVSTPVFFTHSPNTKATEEFITAAAPDMAIACCKVILKEQIFSIPVLGTL